jgi:hypothetical protein
MSSKGIKVAPDEVIKKELEQVKSMNAQTPSSIMVGFEIFHDLKSLLIKEYGEQACMGYKPLREYKDE